MIEAVMHIADALEKTYLSVLYTYNYRMLVKMARDAWYLFFLKVFSSYEKRYAF